MKRLGIYLERRPNCGGAYQYCLSLLKALSEFPKEEFEITAFVMYREWEPILEKMGIRAVYAQKNLPEKVLYHLAELFLPVSACREICGYIHPFGRKLRQLHIDYCIYPCADKISFMMKTPAIISVLDLMHRYLTEFPEIADPAVYKSRERSYTNIAKYGKLILVDSEVGKKQMVECYDTDGTLAKKVVSLPFIAPDYIYDSTVTEHVVRPQVFDKYIFYPAQFWKHKNHKNLLLAMKKLKEQGIRVNLVCSGTNKNGYADTMHLIEELGLQEQVQILGYVSNEEMVALYKYARALVMPTFFGPTNIPPLEAFVLGCPVAVSGIYGMPEQVGDAALLFDPYSVEEIAECVGKLWEDDEVCKRLVLAGYEKAGKWNEQTFRKQLLQYMENL